MIRLNLTLLIFLFPYYAHPQTTYGGTAMAAIKDSQQIVFGVDSYVMNSHGEWTGETICKVGCVDSLYFAVSGTATSDSIGYNVFSLIVRSVDIQGCFKRKVENFIDSAYQQVNRLVAYLKVNDSEGYNYCITKSPVSVSFFGNEGDSIFLANIRFHVDTTNGRDTISSIPLFFPGNSTRELFVGKDSLAAVFDKTYGKERVHWPPLRTVQEFLNFMIRSDSLEYGPPINILWIDRTGRHQWIEGSNPQCQECN